MQYVEFDLERKAMSFAAFNGKAAELNERVQLEQRYLHYAIVPQVAYYRNEEKAVTHGDISLKRVILDEQKNSRLLFFTPSSVEGDEKFTNDKSKDVQDFIKGCDTEKDLRQTGGDGWGALLIAGTDENPNDA
ncbi:hypothetical protein MAR_003111 [Mya arenaria]|uniref:Uncharacterized protein n=1 Tax=Mya arenaria TaxID=6604 RepID=A0ABY7G8N3_MYAAR|nr:hypothetical protein MAR_003111 [Mya arenaria]